MPIKKEGELNCYINFCFLGKVLPNIGNKKLKIFQAGIGIFLNSSLPGSVLSVSMNIQTRKIECLLSVPKESANHG
jgi:hypothetical protein